MAKNTIERKYYNSAIGSWAGFIYQGLCGLYHCLRLIAEDRDKYKDYKLYLDSYEDFAIMADNDKLVSLHQCKNEKNVTDYTAEFRKMKRKLKILADQCTDECRLYFHTNKELKVEQGIIMYPFTNNQNYSEPGELISLIYGVVNLLLHQNESTINKVVYSLVALVDQKVLDIHQKYITKKNKEALYKIAKEEYSAISFQSIIDRFFAKEEVFAYDRDSYITRIKYKLIKDLDNMCSDVDNDEITDEQKERISFLIERLRAMKPDEMEPFLRRVHPIDDISKRSVDDYANVSANGKVLALFNVVSELELLDDDLSWNTTKGKETPTSLNKDMKAATLCKKIIRNKTNNDSLYEYDWLVGDVLEIIDDIGAYLPTISDLESKTNDERSIFETKKVGLVSKQDKIDGKY